LAGPFSNVSVGDPYAAEGTTGTAPTCSSNIASPQLPAFCRVTGGIAEPRAAEPINFEVWLPLTGWNGKFEALGNHGFSGEIEYSDMGPELVKGYAVVATDTGHAGASLTASMQNRQQIINYGYLGVHEMTVKSKAIIKAFYGKPPKYSYFNGCSTGGKEGLMEAQRYPDDYDGINSLDQEEPAARAPAPSTRCPTSSAGSSKASPPHPILASHVTAGTVDRTRPLCPYPAFALYAGQGSTDDAGNFACQEPLEVPNYFVINGPEMDDPYPPRPSH
jgi:feruloyl esterase